MGRFFFLPPFLTITYRPRCEISFANKKGADQPAHPHSLISAFVMRLLESIIYKLDTSEISIYYVVSVAEQAGFGMTISETLKTGFLASRPI